MNSYINVSFLYDLLLVAGFRLPVAGFRVPGNWQPVTGNCYSVLNDFTGFAKAALSAL
jgi:hypothetical protein